ncbi:MAG: hypothetical protein AAGC91_09110 [Pseudomonadota bacterium]
MGWVIQSSVILLPLLSGVCLARFALAGGLPTHLATFLGFTIVFGAASAAGLLAILDALSVKWTNTAFTVACVVLLVAECVAIYLTRTRSIHWCSSARGTTRSQRFLATALALLILAHILLAAIDALNRPLFPWDATMHWATKAKVWFEQQRLVDFVTAEQWIEARRDSLTFTDEHPDYPVTMPLLQVWMCIAQGHWSSVAINLPWVLFLCSLALLFYGESRLLGVSWLTALLFTYFLVSLPLLGTHVALSGYADFPQGVVFFAAFLLVQRAFMFPDWMRGLLALALAIFVTQVKNEGFFWAASLLATSLFMVQPLVRALGISAATLLLVVIAFFLVPQNFEFAGHSLASLKIGFRPEHLAALPQQFYATLSWNLMFLVLASGWLAFFVVGTQDRVLRAMFVTVAATTTLYILLYSLTKYAPGSTRLTSAPRIFLHLAPLQLFFAMLVWQRLVNRYPGSQAV